MSFFSISQLLFCSSFRHVRVVSRLLINTIMGCIVASEHVVIKHVVVKWSYPIHYYKDTTFGDEENGYLTHQTAAEVETSLNSAQNSHRWP